MRTGDQGSGEQIQALVESLAVLEPLGDGREKEEKGDMSLGKSIVLGMDKFSCEIGQDPSAHAARGGPGGEHAESVGHGQEDCVSRNPAGLPIADDVWGGGRPAGYL